MLGPDVKKLLPECQSPCSQDRTVRPYPEPRTRIWYFFEILFNVVPYTGIPRLTTLRTYDALHLPPCPKLEALASQLRHLSDMTLPLASASTIRRRCFQFAYKDVSLCISVIKWILLIVYIITFILLFFLWLKLHASISEKKCIASSCDSGLEPNLS